MVHLCNTNWKWQTQLYVFWKDCPPIQVLVEDISIIKVHNGIKSLDDMGGGGEWPTSSHPHINKCQKSKVLNEDNTGTLGIIQGGKIWGDYMSL